MIVPRDVEEQAQALATGPGRGVVLPIPGVELVTAKKKPRGKYGNRKVTYDGRTFDSARECERYKLLKALQAGGAIRDLRLQVEVRCEVSGKLVCVYRADFVYVRDGKEVVEDAKGYRTKEYKLKKKLVLACTGIEIQEV